MMNSNFQFETTRLLVNDWREWQSGTQTGHSLAHVVQSIMTPTVTATLPPPWQGEYSLERAAAWISDQDKESINLLAVDKGNNTPIGVMILFEIAETREVRLGYMLHESAWGKGYASELVAGLVHCCRNNGTKTITGGVGVNNPASSRVLQKCGFIEVGESADEQEVLYSIQL